MTPQRISKILSANGIASRRGAERLILDGRVYVNGVCANIGQSADLGIDEISVDGTPIAKSENPVYIMLNKPCGYLTTVSDDRGRKTVMGLISDVGTRVYPIGRLDMQSDGLLLFTNDGAFANKVMHPSFNKQKTYEISVRGDVSNALPKLKMPMLIDAHEVRAKSVTLIRKTDGGGILSISIGEGRNKQVRKMCESCGLHIKTLTRVAIGALELGSLEPGKWRHLTLKERRLLHGVNEQE